MKLSVFAAVLASLCVCISAGEPASPQPEPWADSKLSDVRLKTALALWLDASSQEAAWKAHGKPALVADTPVEICYDGSGYARDFVQTIKDAQPRFSSAKTPATLKFDGKKSHLVASVSGLTLNEFTVLMVAAPRSNAGGFRALFAGHELKKNDYTSGFNLDMGSNASPENFNQLNVEGKGFGGERNLLIGQLPFGAPRLIGFTSKVDANGIKGFVNADSIGQRKRDPGELKVEELTLGARCYSNVAAPPYIQGFFDGDIAEVLIWNRVLSNDELKSAREYLTKKYGPELVAPVHTPLVTEPLLNVANPPELQMLLPGYSVRRLPLDLTNINNLRYRDDGKLVALAYDGNIYLLSDTDGDGLEDKAELFWESKGRVTQPIGMALTPPGYAKGRGVFVANKGKLSLIVDKDGDDKADDEIVVATGWKLSFHGVDALGVAIADDGSIYFGVGTTNFADPLLKDKEGNAHYDIKSERGTILKVAPDFSKREIVCTGIRFSVGMAFNKLGDLFCTDQEGATWVPSGNPLDELLHIQPGRHYGFPPRHPKFIPNVIDEPSVFDYGPQHQSTCGLVFNEPVNGGPVFGSAHWQSDALVTGESRGKIYRTKLAKTASGYVAATQLLSCLNILTIDACVTPRGELAVCAHSGNPDWGTGPTGKGKLFKVSIRDKEQPQPMLCWAANPHEVRIAFDRPLDPAVLKGSTKDAAVEFGAYVSAGDRFEKMRPGYEAIKRQLSFPRHELPVSTVNVTPDFRTLILSTTPQSQIAGYTVILPHFGASQNKEPQAKTQVAQADGLDLGYDLNGVIAEWSGPTSQASVWLPHPDFSVAKSFTAGSAEHDAFWRAAATPGRMKLRTKLDLWSMLRPAIQPGSTLDYSFPSEEVRVTFQSRVQIALKVEGVTPERFVELENFARGFQRRETNGVFLATIAMHPKEGELLPVEIELPTQQGALPTLEVTFATNEDARPRALPLRRFVLPWAVRKIEKATAVANADIPELKGGNWLRGRELFYGTQANCSACHQVRRRGSDIGPDLSNLIHRDYESVLRDIRDPSGAIHPDYLSYQIKLKDGRVFTGIPRNTADGRVTIAGETPEKSASVASSDIALMKPSAISLMPAGIDQALGAEKLRDLLTFLLTEPLSPAPLTREGAPPLRTRAEVEKILAADEPAPATPLNVVLCAGPKDHGIDEHDYPVWQRRWNTLLSLADKVTVGTADSWPSAEQWASADVIVFYSANPSWNTERAKDLEAFLARGGGLVMLHFAINGQKDFGALAEYVGLAWGGKPLFRHGPLELSFPDNAHPITKGFDKLKLIDESYWQLAGDPNSIHILATGNEQEKPQPLFWTREKGKGRVFVSVPGHYTWTFDDPLYRVLILRGICWAAGKPIGRLNDLVMIGARIQN